MHLNEGDIVYLHVSSSDIVEQCKVTAVDFGEEGQHLVMSINSRDGYVANTDDLYKTAEECAVKTSEKRAAKYKKHYDNFDSMEMLLLHLLWSAIESDKHDDLEIAAMIHRASEFIGADMMKAVEKYTKSMEKEEKAKKATVEL